MTHDHPPSRWPAPHGSGRTLTKGIGTNVNLSEAQRWFRKASDQGLPLASYYLAKTYLEMKEYALAEVAFSAAAKKNHAPSLYCLGRMYLRGDGVDRQPAKARDFLETAAALGNVWAKRELAGLLMSGAMGPLSRLRGVYLFLSALKDGLILALGDASSERLSS